LTGNGRAVALRVLAAVAVFWVAEFALLLAYVLFIRAGHGAIGSGSLTAAGALLYERVVPTAGPEGSASRGGSSRPVNQPRWPRPR